MHYRPLGRTGLHASAVSMGTWKSFDVRVRKEIEHVSELVTEALRCGVNLFDAAPMYGEAEAVVLPATSRRERVRENTAVADTPALPPAARQQLEAMFA
ncbi:MAG TPA: aldo/keto reductase [Methylomirabilota bacterium]|jgi:aryl-alcohol dehydrogenase-like predicted oxidoreductase|nr:aldo/keto reductase [Methylomirabilota bacterium]